MRPVALGVFDEPRSLLPDDGPEMAGAMSPLVGAAVSFDGNRRHRVLPVRDFAGAFVADSVDVGGIEIRQLGLGRQLLGGFVRLVIIEEEDGLA